MKAATGEFRKKWHKFLPLAVLNHNTTYHATLGCEPTRVFHGRIPYNILDYKLGYNPNPRYKTNTDIAEEIQRRMEILTDQTKKNIMQSYLRYKAYYDRKAKAAPLTTDDYCYILNPKADTQATKIPFRDFRWIGPYKVEKVLPNNNYIVRRLGTNKTQLLHRIRLRKYTPTAPLADKIVRETDWEKDDSPEISQEDLYAQAWDTNFGPNPFELTPPNYNSNEEHDEDPNAQPIQNHPPTRNNLKTSGGIPADQPAVTEITQPNDNPTPETSEPLQNEEVSEIAPNPGNTPKTPENTNGETSNSQKTQNTPKNFSKPDAVNTRGEKYNLRPNPNPNFSDSYRY